MKFKSKTGRTRLYIITKQSYTVNRERCENPACLQNKGKIIRRHKHEGEPASSLS
jgi:hypothetical protein